MESREENRKSSVRGYICGVVQYFSIQTVNVQNVQNGRQTIDIFLAMLWVN